MPLDSKDSALARLYMASCFHSWALLPDLGRSCYHAGCSMEEVRGCLRHLIAVAGYGSCLAATNHLHAAKLLEGNTPGKIGGPPGNAFELVYGPTTDTVRRKMHAADPVLCELIRLHLYGDVYSSPGLSMRQKQTLMVAFLAEADMHEQLFGHLLAAMRFGSDKESCLEAIDIGFEMAPKPISTVYRGALRTLKLAYEKHKLEERVNGTGPSSGSSAEVVVPDPTSVSIPELHLR